MRGKAENYEGIPGSGHGYGPTMFTCLRCGAAVHTMATYRHDMWHDAEHDGDVRTVK